MKARLFLSLFALVYSILYTINPAFFMKRIQKRMDDKEEKDRQRLIKAQKKANAKAGLENPPDDEIAPPSNMAPIKVSVRTGRIMGVVMIVACTALAAYCAYNLYIVG